MLTALAPSQQNLKLAVHYWVPLAWAWDLYSVRPAFTCAWLVNMHLQGRAAAAAAPDVLLTRVMLMQGSTVVDCAYALGTEFGDGMVGAKVNNQWVPLGHVLKEADVVEIVTSDDPPSAVSVSQRQVGALPSNSLQWLHWAAMALGCGFVWAVTDLGCIDINQVKRIEGVTLIVFIVLLVLSLEIGMVVDSA